jgi:hypothetical protein
MNTTLPPSPRPLSPLPVSPPNVETGNEAEEPLLPVDNSPPSANVWCNQIKAVCYRVLDHPLTPLVSTFLARYANTSEWTPAIREPVQDLSGAILVGSAVRAFCVDTREGPRNRDEGCCSRSENIIRVVVGTGVGYVAAILVYEAFKVLPQ